MKKQIFTALFVLAGNSIFAQPFTEQTGIVLEALSYGSVAWGDYDRDGDLDVLMTGYSYGGDGLTTAIYRNNGNNTFTRMTGISLTGVNNSDADWGDYDNDGDLDILLSGSSYTGDVTKIYRNNGNSTFTEQTTIDLAGAYFSKVSWCDYDLDGDLDILLTGNCQQSYISKIYRNNGDNTFTEQAGIQLEGVINSSTDWGDYDNDGDPDLLLTGYSNAGPISKVYRNNGDNTFTDQTHFYLNGVFYSSVDWGDYDNDGDLDILLTGGLSHGRVSWVYRNEGSEYFSRQSGITLAAVSNGSATWCDMDNDGDLDIMITGTNVDGSASICKFYSNNGNNSFSERTDIVLPGITNSVVAWGDYDNDNDLDIVLSGQSDDGHISKIYRNETTVPDIAPSAPSGLQSFWNGDAITFNWNRSSDNTTPDKAIQYNIRIGTSSGGNQLKSGHALSNGRLLTPEITSLINDTCITYKLPLDRYYWSVQAVDNSKIAGVFAPQQIKPADSIQAKNLQAAIKSSNSLLIRWTNGNGTRRALFGRISSTADEANPVNGLAYKAEPLFGDGDQIGSTGWFCLYNGKADSVFVYGLGEGYSYDFQVIEYIESAGLPVYFKTTGTGNPGAFSSTLYSEQTGIALTEVFTSFVAWGDLDNDGYLDIVSSGNVGYGNAFTKAYRNNGDNTFTEQTGISFPSRHYAADIVDYDNDADLDILLINSDYIMNENFMVFRNNGDGTFSGQSPVTLGFNVSSAVSGDYDNDGYLDILMTGESPDTPVTRIYKNNGNNTFTEQTGIVLSGVYEGSSAWGDYNNDGYTDFVVTGRISRTQWTTMVYKNNGDGSFSVQTGIPLPGVFSSAVAWEDYDNDNDLDLLLAGQSSSYYFAQIYRNNGDNTFNSQGSMSLPGVNQCNVAWGDYNNDGHPDILITGYSSTYGAISRIYRNFGNNYFSEVTGISLTGASNSDCEWGDYDNDGDLDIMIGSKVYSNNTFMRAGSYPANNKPAAPQQLSSQAQPDGTELSWDPVTTDETVHRALSYNIKIGTTPGNNNVLTGDADNITGYRRIPAMGNARADLFFLIKDLASGNYFWNVQAVDQSFAGGEWSETGTFEVKNVQAFFNANEVCHGLPTSFTDQSVVTDGIASWYWDFGDGDTSSVQDPVHTFSEAGTQNVMLVVTSTTGIKDTLLKNVIVWPKPFAGLTAPVVCQGAATTITNTTDNNGLTITSWLWEFGDGNTSSEQDPSPHGYLNAGDYYVKLTATADNGCADSLTRTVTVSRIPNAKIGLDFGYPTFCTGDSCQLSVEQNDAYSYQWKLNDFNITGETTSQLKIENSGDYSVVIVNPVGNCSVESEKKTISVIAAPEAPAVAASIVPATICSGDSVRLEAAYVPDYTYQWRLNEGTTGSDTNVYYAVSEGNYTLEVSVGEGCKSPPSSPVFLEVLSLPDKPTIEVSGPTGFCEGDSIVLSIPDSAGNMYRWGNDYGFIPGMSGTEYTAKESGNYFVEVTNQNNCSSISNAMEVVVSSAPEPPTIIAQGPVVFCQGDSVEISTEYNPDFTYQWKYNEGNIGTSSNKIYARQEGNYSLVIEVTGVGLCSQARSNMINITTMYNPDKPTISLDGPAEICTGQTVILSVPSVLEYTYQWKYNDNNLSGAIINEYAAALSGDYSIQVINSDGCKTLSDAIKITVSDPPPINKITALTDTIICQGQEVILEVPYDPQYTYQWKLDGINVWGETNSTIYAEKEGLYTVDIANNTCVVITDPMEIKYKSGLRKPILLTFGTNPYYFVCNIEDAGTYRWYRDDHLVTENNSNVYWAGTLMGEYYVEVNDGGECYVPSDKVVIPVIPTGTSQPGTENGIYIYPNPAKKNIMIFYSCQYIGKVLVRIYDLNGEVLKEKEIMKHNVDFSEEIALPGFDPGIYILALFTDQAMMITRFLVID